MSIDKLKNKFSTGAFVADVKHYFTKINEIIDYLNGDGKSGDGSYKVYTALVTQSGTNAPVAIILENTLGETPLWVRNLTGNYSLTSNSLFTINKTTISHKSLVSDDINYKMQSILSNNFRIDFSTFDTFVQSDNVLSFPELIEIRVYN